MAEKRTIIATARFADYETYAAFWQSKDLAWHQETGRQLLTGDAPKAAAFVGLDNISSFFTAVTRSNKGTYRRYIIRNVKGKERVS